MTFNMPTWIDTLFRLDNPLKMFNLCHSFHHENKNSKNVNKQRKVSIFK